MKSVVSDSDSSDNENETKDTGKNLDLSLEKLNLGPKKKLLVLNLGGLLVDRVHRPNESAVRRYGGASMSFKPYIFLKKNYEICINY